MNFSQVEYLTVFSSIIFGLVVAEYLHSWGNLRKWDRGLINNSFILWTAFQLLFLLNVWWGSWIRNDKLSEHIGYYYLSLTTPILLYIISIITFPDSRKSLKVNLYKHFNKRFSKIMFLYFLIMISIIFNSYFFNPEPFFRTETYIMFLATVLTLAGTGAKSRSSQNTILILAWIMLLSHILFIPSRFPDNLDDQFSQSEYLTTFIAIVYGYVATIFFMGWGRLIRNLKLKEVEWYHLSWTLFAFVLLIDMWWSSWRYIDVIALNFGFFFLSILPPLVFYYMANSLFSVVNLPRSIHQHFQLAAPIVFRLFAAILILNIIISIVFKELSPLDYKNIIRFSGAVFGIIVSTSKSRVIQISIATIAWILYFTHLLLDEI